jgi:hypothetical protein
MGLMRRVSAEGKIVRKAQHTSKALSPCRQMAEADTIISLIE